MSDTFFNNSEEPNRAPDPTNTQTFFNTPTPERPTPAETESDPREAILRRRQTFSLSGFGLFALIIGLYAANIALDLLLYGVLGEPYLTSWWRTWTLSLLPLYGVGLPCMYLVIRRAKKAPHNTDYTHRTLLPGGLSATVTEEKPPLKLSGFLILLVIGLGVMQVGNIIGSVLMSILSAITGYPYANALVSAVNDSPLWLTFLAACVCAPIGEEFIFRKLLIDRTRRYGDVVSILLSGVLFGLFHGNFFQFFYATLLGFVLAYLYTRTGKVYLCMIVHAIVNIMGSIVVPGIAGLIPADETAAFTPVAALATLFVLAWSYGLMIAALALFCVNFSRWKLSRGTEPLTAAQVKDVILNPGMLAILILMTVLMIISLIPPAA